MNLSVACAAAFVLASTACGGGTRDEGVVARAGVFAWTVEQATDLLARKPDLRVDRDVVRSLAELWIDYTLLAAAAMEDSTLAQVDVSNMVQDLVNEQLVLALRDSVIAVRPIGRNELLARYRAEAPGSLIRVRQILLVWPPNATEAQRDSMRREIGALRRRIVEGGEDFARVAQTYSQDPGSKGIGGALPPFGRGQMLGPIEDAAFSLALGAVSEPVASPFGLHLIKVEGRPLPSVESFRSNLMARQTAAAESSYVAHLETVTGLSPVEGAYERARVLALQYREPLSQRDAEHPLMVYQGGAVTEAEFLWHLQAQAPELRTPLATARDSSIAVRALRGVAHQELLAQAALARGWSVPQARQDELAAVVRSNLAAAARQLRLLPIAVRRDASPESAVPMAVDSLLSGILTGTERVVTPLGAMSYVLRLHTSFRVIDSGLSEVVARMASAGRGGAEGSH